MRFAAGVAAWLATRYADLPFMQDASYYEELALGVANDWIAGQSSPWLESAMSHGHQPWLMVAVLAVFYFLAGGLQITPVVMALCCLVTAWAPVLTYRIARQLGTPAAGARMAGWLVALSPAFAFWAGALYKEGLILIVLNLTLYHALRLQEAWRPQSLLVLALCVPALLGLRFYLVLILGPVVGLGLLLGRASGRSQEAGAEVAIRQIFLVACLLAASVGIGFTDRARQFLPGDLSEGMSRLQNSRDDLANQPSGYLSGANVATPIDALRFLPLGLLYFLTVPWPWELGALRQNLVIPETAFWVLLYPVMLVGVQKSFRRNVQGTLLLLAATLSICALYALLVANVGVAYRLRIQVWAVWAIFAGWGWDALRRRGADASMDVSPGGSRQ
jgi:hypothetical protein